MASPLRLCAFASNWLPYSGGGSRQGAKTQRPLRGSGERRLSWFARMRLLPFFKNFFDFGAGPRIDVARAVFAATHHLAFELFSVNRVLGGLDHFVGELRREKQYPLFVTDYDVTRQDRYLADANWRVPFDSDLVGHRRSVSAGVVGREIFHRQKLVQITNASVNDHAPNAGQFHGQPGHVAHNRRAIHGAAEFDHRDVSGPPVFARPDVVLIIPIALFRQLTHALIEVGTNWQITHRQCAPDHLHAGLRQLEMIDETESITLVLHSPPHRFDRQGLHLRQLFVGDARAFVFQHVHQWRPGVPLRAQAGRNLNLRLRFELKRCDGNESNR